MSNLGENFYPKLVKISSELGMNPEDLIAVMVSESGLNPSSYEKKFHGSGLVGFMPDTLKGLGYTGSWDDFIKLSGEQQLEYVKKIVQNNMKLNGGPFISAAQYYVANLWPVALKLPGIRQGNPSTAFIEEKPETVVDPKNGQKYSKKYYDLGFRITPGSEAAAYKYNPLFHGSVPGAITYADMMKQVDKIKQNSLYKKAINDLHNSTNFRSNDDDTSKINLFKKYISTFKNAPSQNQEKSDTKNISSILDSYLQQISANNKKIYRKFLPSHDLLISVGSDNYCNSVEFARILCYALEEDLLAQAYTHTDGDKVEINCKINGPEKECFAAVQELTNVINDNFYINKKEKFLIKTQCILNKCSNLKQIDYKTASQEYNKFLQNLRKK